MRKISEGHCDRCGYDLGGLAMVGSCPECGREYDWHSGHGFAERGGQRQAKFDRLLKRVRTISLAAVGLSAVLCGGVGSAMSDEPARPLVLGMVFAGFFGLAALVSYLYEKPEE